MPGKRIAAGKLDNFLKEVFLKAGMPDGDAGFAAMCTVTTELWGIETHGTLRTPHYVMRLRKGAINPTPKMTDKLAGDTPLGLLDGDAGLGYVVGRAGMCLAIEKAKQHGVGLVVAVNSNHYGAAGLYARIASGEGFIGVSSSNVRPNIATRGAKVSVVGNNPIALSAPIPGGPDFCIDIAMSVTPAGKLKLAALKGEKIPFGLAIDKDGNDTDDPAAAFAGIILPVGAHKGYGIALFVDIITGLLGGATYLDQIHSMYSHPEEPSNLSHLFIALDPERFMSRDEFNARMADWHRRLKAVPMAGPDPIVMPGEPEMASEKRLLKDGIPIPPQLWNELTAMACELGVGMPETL